MTTSYGTGFFVSPAGEIVTNTHVVSNMVADKDVNKSVDKVLKALKSRLAARYYELDEQYRQAYQYYRYAGYSGSAGYDELYK